MDLRLPCAFDVKTTKTDPNADKKSSSSTLAAKKPAKTVRVKIPAIFCVSLSITNTEIEVFVPFWFFLNPNS